MVAALVEASRTVHGGAQEVDYDDDFEDGDFKDEEELD